MVKKRALPIGIDDFAKVIQEKYFYADKTLMIKELLDKQLYVPLIVRPRRFGKTLNISMLRYFFEKTENDKYKHLFDGLAVSQHPDIMVRRGKYPIIFLTLKGIDARNWNDAYNDIKLLISNEWKRHRYLTASEKLFEDEQKKVYELVTNTSNDTIYKHSLKLLCEYLNKHYGVKPIVLIDEYDTPIHAGYKYGYDDQVVEFMRGWLGQGLKGNSDLEFSVITGILKVAKESIFSGLNNLLVCDTTGRDFSDTFGLTKKEVAAMLHEYELGEHISDAEKWYNGYQFYNCKIYNPWSLLHFVKNNGGASSYWVRTGVDDIIKPLLQKASDDVKFDLQTLMAGGTVDTEKNENITFSDLSSSATTIWNFILGCGYVTWVSDQDEQAKEVVSAKKVSKDTITLIIPNEEIKTFFRQTIKAWFENSGQLKLYTLVLDALTRGDMITFASEFKRLVPIMLSFFDVGDGNEPENFYHAFVLGMLVSLQATHQIKSNREAGIGRFDVMLIPRNTNMVGAVLEFKKFEAAKDKTLLDSAQKALAQIKEKKYVVDLHDAGVKNVILVGMGFEKKEVEVVYEK